MAEKALDNQRYSDLAWETWRTSGFHAAIDAVVAAVREDDAKHLASYRRAMLRRGRRDAARDCAAKIEFGERAARFFARIAEGNTDRAGD